MNFCEVVPHEEIVKFVKELDPYYKATAKCVDCEKPGQVIYDHGIVARYLQYEITCPECYERRCDGPQAATSVATEIAAGEGLGEKLALVHHLMRLA